MADSDDFPAALDESFTEVTRPSFSGGRVMLPANMIELTAGTPVGEYEIEKQIGEGAMGTVYAAMQPMLGKRVAIKVLKPELCANQASIDRFVAEAQAVTKIGHPNIVDVFSLGELPDGRAYFVMEWLRGEDLRARLARGPLSQADACDILDGIAHALEAAHGKQIVHRDLKPDNVFLHQLDGEPMMVKLLDFGIAKLVRVTPGAEKTQTGNMLGTPRYISPEQARGIQVDHRSDIYSLGVIAYELLGGKTPFDGETAMDLVVQHLNEPPPPLGALVKLPRSLERCVMGMLAKEPGERPTLATVREVLADPTRRLSLPGLARVKKRARWPLLAVGLGAAGGIGFAVWQRMTRTEERPVPAVTAAESAREPMPQPAPPSPAPAPPPVPVRGTLEVDVHGAAGSVILVDGEEWGRGASIKVELAPGTHEVVVQPPGRAELKKSVEVKAGEVATLAFDVPRPAARPTARPVAKPKPQPADEDDLLRPKGKR